MIELGFFEWIFYRWELEFEETTLTYRLHRVPRNHKMMKNDTAFTMLLDYEEIENLISIFQSGLKDTKKHF